MSERLNDRQAIFVAEYLTDLNASRAAVRAGYGRRDARNAGYRNLRKPKIRAAIAEAQAPRFARLALDADRVLNELARIALADVLDCVRFEDGKPVVDLSQLDRDAVAALSEVVIEEAGGTGKGTVKRIRYRQRDKLAALDKLARHLGLLGGRAPAESPAPPPDRPQHHPRQVARAVLAILEEARLAGEEEEDTPTYPAVADPFATAD